MKTTPKKAIATVARATMLIMVNVLVLVLLLIGLEGAASWAVALREIAATEPVAERLHTRYDAELGWVSLPNVRKAAMYGPAADLTTNSRGFRGRGEITPQVPAGRIRVICSGDSFTLGYGVGDNDTWCHRLAERDRRLETVNMGQGGYGFDQAYLWYRRDASDLQHHIHVFAFITDDLHRMTSDRFLGYPKPVLRAENGQLQVDNVPVPRRRAGGEWFATNAEAIRSLRLFTVAGSVLRRLGGRGSGDQTHLTTYDKTRDVLPLILADLKQRNAARGSRFVLVYLPTTYELNAQAPARWSKFFQEQADKNDFIFIDLFGPFRAFPQQHVSSLVIQPHEVAFRSAEGHLNRAGNDVVATLLYDALVDQGAIPRDSTSKTE